LWSIVNKVFNFVVKGDITMSYIKAIVTMKDYRLFMDMESGSVVIVDLSVKLNTMKYKELADERMFRSARTDGDYVVWGDGRVRLTAKELLDVVLLGEYQ
jgi:hypothetical protein